MGKQAPKSVWVFHVDSGSCNGCDIEILDMLTPYYDPERFGIKLVGTPRHADALLVTGPMTRQCRRGVQKVYEAMPPKPRIVVAVGSCASSGGIFYDGYPIYRSKDRFGRDRLRSGGVEEVLPVDMYIPGCPPSPEAILFGVAQLLGLKEKKMKGEYYTDKETEFKLPQYPIEERIRLSLRESLKKVIGYFDRDRVLEDFMEIAGEANRAENPKEKLHALVTGYFLQEKDSRLKFSMKFLENEYWRLKDDYENKYVALVETHVQ